MSEGSSSSNPLPKLKYGNIQSAEKENHYGVKAQILYSAQLLLLSLFFRHFGLIHEPLYILKSMLFGVIIIKFI